MIAFIGSGPYCYANSLAMSLGDHAPSPSVIEVLTGSPFGIELIGGRMPFFDPYGWDPDQGVDAAIRLLGWDCVRNGAEDDEEALGHLREALKNAPVMAGPMEFGLLLQNPDMTGPIESDHFVLVLAVEAELVRFHDPHGFAYATLPIPAFLAAWRADTIAYKTTKYTMRSAFRRARTVSAQEALRASLPAAAAWLGPRTDVEVPPGTLGGQAAADRLAEMIADGLDPAVHGHLVHFAVRVGARRLADAATALAELGLDKAAACAERQARLVGSLQYDLVAGHSERATATMRDLGLGYAELGALLSA